MTSYDRPVQAALHVHLDNGETWEVTNDDLAKFGLVRRLDAYMSFSRALVQPLLDAGLIEREKDITRTELNAVRYLAETAICHPHLLDHAEHEGWASIADLERRLAAAREPAEA